MSIRGRCVVLLQGKRMIKCVVDHWCRRVAFANGTQGELESASDVGRWKWELELKRKGKRKRKRRWHSTFLCIYGCNYTWNVLNKRFIRKYWNIRSSHERRENFHFQTSELHFFFLMVILSHNLFMFLCNGCTYYCSCFCKGIYLSDHFSRFCIHICENLQVPNFGRQSNFWLKIPFSLNFGVENLIPNSIIVSDVL